MCAMFDRLQDSGTICNQCVIDRKGSDPCTVRGRRGHSVAASLHQYQYVAQGFRPASVSVRSAGLLPCISIST